jgi:hypothetical protein
MDRHYFWKPVRNPHEKERLDPNPPLPLTVEARRQKKELWRISRQVDADLLHFDEEHVLYTDSHQH